MQTYTHLAIGAVAGSLLFPDNSMAQIACTAGSIAPDLASVPMFILDKLRGKQPFVGQSKFFLVVKEVTHSIPVWLLGCLLSVLILPWQPLLAFFVCGTAHLIIDVLTHGGKEYEDDDPRFLWPLFRKKLAQNMGLWEYRYDQGSLKPKPLEIIIIIVSIIAVILLHL